MSLHKRKDGVPLHYKHYREIFKEKKRKKEPVFVRRVCEKIIFIQSCTLLLNLRVGLPHERKFVQTNAHKSSSQIRQETFEACQVVRIVDLCNLRGYCINMLFCRFESDAFLKNVFYLLTFNVLSHYAFNYFTVSVLIILIIYT